MARAGSQTQFEQAAEDLLCYAGLRVQAREIERIAEEVGRQVEQWLSEEQEQIVRSGLSAPPPLEPGAKFYISFDGTGIPVRKSELLGRKGKQADGSARTREVKLGCLPPSGRPAARSANQPGSVPRRTTAVLAAAGREALKPEAIRSPGVEATGRECCDLSEPSSIRRPIVTGFCDWAGAESADLRVCREPRTLLSNLRFSIGN
jgi:hypothetical protein